MGESLGDYIKEYIKKKEKQEMDVFNSIYSLFRGIITIYGDSGTLKTTFVANFAQWLISKNIPVKIIDTEGSISKTFPVISKYTVKIAPTFESLINAIKEEKTGVLIIDSIGIVSNRYFALRSVIDKEHIKAAREVAVNIQAVYALLFDRINNGDIKSAIVVNQPVSVLGVDRQKNEIPPMLGDKADFYSKERYYFNGKRIVRVIAERSEKFPYGTVIMVLTREGKKINITLKHQL